MTAFLPCLQKLAGGRGLAPPPFPQKIQRSGQQQTGSVFMLRSGWRKWADEKIGLHIIVVAKGAQKRRNHMRPSHGCGGSGKGGRGTKSHANFAWLCPLRGRKRARSHMNFACFSGAPTPARAVHLDHLPVIQKRCSASSPLTGSGGSPLGVHHATATCVETSQRLWRMKGTRKHTVLKMRTCCGDQGERKNRNVLTLRSGCGDHGEREKQLW